MLKDLVEKNRSYRRFEQSEALDEETLYYLIDLARLCPSARNVQTLRFLPINRPSQAEKVFACLTWAGALTGWSGPKDGECPSAYIIILRRADLHDAAGVDHGIAAQTMLLGAVEKGLGGCMIGSIDRKQLREAFAIDESYEILLVLALGKPAEEVVIEELQNGQSCDYWRDDKGVHHVPKRRLVDIVLQPSAPNDGSWH